MTIQLSVLDHSWITSGQDAAAAFARTIELAQRTEELGYSRFWVSEHHDTPNIAGSSPEVLISHLLAKTDRIRVGSGGIMLQHYSPYKVAENFNVLASLAPGRVDLGIGRAPGGLPRATAALSPYSPHTPSVDEKLEQLASHLKEAVPEDPSVAGLRAIPIPPSPPELYVLGSSESSGLLAAKLGLPYVFALIINEDVDAAARAFRLYRSNFRENAAGPRALLALSVIVGETDEEAQRLASENARIKFIFENGQTYTALSRQEAASLRFQGRYTTRSQPQQTVFGSKVSVRRKLLELQRDFGVEEFLVTTILEDFDARVRSYRLLMDAFPEAAESRTASAKAAYPKNV